jgi:hypothetical protein
MAQACVALCSLRSRAEQQFLMHVLQVSMQHLTFFDVFLMFFCNYLVSLFEDQNEFFDNLHIIIVTIR